MALFLYAVTLFVSAFLLFLVQPIIGQKILPKLGGTPSVWNTCVVFFQLALLVGYAYTHFTSKLPVKRQIMLHCLLLFVPFLILLPGFHPFNVDDFKPVTGGNPITQTLTFLAIIVGIPFFVVSTTAPLLQKWFGATGHPAAKDPYFLYGASNFGSMLSLLMYPPVFEMFFGLEQQSWFYTFGYMALVGLVVCCAAMAFLAPPTVQLPGSKKEMFPEKVPSLDPEPPPEPASSAEQVTTAPTTAVTANPPGLGPKPTMATGFKKGGKKGKQRDLAKTGAASTAIAPRGTAAALAAAAPNIARPAMADPDDITWYRRLRWIGLAAVPSSLMLGVTNYMSTDISAIPLFWVLPLALYLLSFILVFMRWPIQWVEQMHDLVLYSQPGMLALLVMLMVIPGLSSVVVMILVMLLAFLWTALACHGEMAKDRPSAKHLTEFYLLMSVGGAVGGLFNGILAPVIFSKWGIVEFGLALAVAGLLRPAMMEIGWIEWMFSKFTSAGDAGHRPGKGGKKIGRSGSEASGMTLVLDILLPLGLTALMAACLWLLFQPSQRDNFALQMFKCVGVPLVLAAFFFDRPLRFGLTLGAVLLLTGLYTNVSDRILYQTRSYFGVLRVQSAGEGYGDLRIPYKTLMHGTTNHGMALQPVPEVDLSRLATTYYHRQGPVGICMERFNWFDPDYFNNSFVSDARMPASLVGLGAPSLGIGLPIDQIVGTWSAPAYAVIGMGTATMSSYCRPYQTCHFFEIDEQIRRLSLELPDPDHPYFGYVKAAKDRGANIKILMGDARLRMAMPWVPKGQEDVDQAKIDFTDRGGAEYFYHLMVVDAFSSDAIPRHLITQQGIEMYFRHLVQGRWGPWIEVDPKEDGRKDLAGNYVDSVKPRFYWDFKGDKEKGPLFKKAWYPGGVLCVHTSNRHLRLVPVVADSANAAVWDDLYDRDADGKPKKQKGLIAIRGHDSAPGHQYLAIKEDIGHFTSEWVIVARDEKDLKHLVRPEKYNEWVKEAHNKKKNLPEREDYWTPLQPTATGTYLWTDDHSNLMAVFRWPWATGSD